MSPISFTKMQSVGNDFVLIREELVEPAALSAFAQKVCSRHYSIGADGLLTIAQDVNGVRLRMFNPDGTEDFCGNGIRCAARYAFDQGLAQSETAIHHLGRAVHTRIGPDGSIRSHFESADFSPVAVPALTDHEIFSVPLEVGGRTLEVSALTTGSTHTVILGPLPCESEFQSLSPLIEDHPLFPDRTSVIWAEAAGERAIRIRIWERGAGETSGCGTGSAAAAVVYFRATQTHGTLEVINPGGCVRVVMTEWDAPFYTEASAETIFTGEVPFSVAALSASLR